MGHILDGNVDQPTVYLVEGFDLHRVRSVRLVLILDNLVEFAANIDLDGLQDSEKERRNYCGPQNGNYRQQRCGDFARTEHDYLF
jgi:hypothetical protein